MPSMTIEIDIDDFSYNELSEELEERGYRTLYVDEVNENLFSKEELDFLCKTIDNMKYNVGSIEWRIREKLSDL